MGGARAVSKDHSRKRRVDRACNPQHDCRLLENNMYRSACVPLRAVMLARVN